MKEIILIKNGELVLKGLNRGTFEMALMKSIRRRLSSLGKWEISKAQSAIFAVPLEETDMDLACEAVSKIFGITAFSRALVCEKNMTDILAKAPVWLEAHLSKVKTFKVEARRSDKAFPLKSPEICRDAGEVLLNAFPHLTVDVHKPDMTVNIEVRDFGAYVHAGQTPGAGGMPIGTGGKAGVLLSGGIDSPVAAWMMAKRGLSLTGIHFASPPYTSPQAEKKVHSLRDIVSEYAGYIPLMIVPFTEIQEKIAKDVPEEYFTLIMRRYMMKIASKLSEKHDLAALITGESLGQVASQTIGALACTDIASDVPVFRPLIGMDKEEIIKISRKIGAFETSIMPFEDCCTIFTPKHPRTRPVLEYILKAEAVLDEENLINNAVNNTVFIK